MRISKLWIGSSSIRWRKREADQVPDGPTQVIADKLRPIIRSLGWGLLLETEYPFSAAENARARENEDALALEWNEVFESRQGQDRRFARAVPRTGA